MSRKKLIVGACASTLCVLLGACKPAEQAPTAPAKVDPQFKIEVGIKDLMAHMIDPAADALWASVSIESTATGEIKHEPKTDEDWKAVRGHAIALMEGANLIIMEGRRVAMEGHELEDHGTEGNLTAAESQHEIDTNRATFIGFAHALHDVGSKMLQAADAKNPQGIMDAGDTLDSVCESCHLKFWYPGQKVPVFPGQAPEVDAPTTTKK